MSWNHIIMVMWVRLQPQKQGETWLWGSLPHEIHTTKRAWRVNYWFSRKALFFAKQKWFCGHVYIWQNWVKGFNVEVHQDWVDLKNVKNSPLNEKPTKRHTRQSNTPKMISSWRHFSKETNEAFKAKADLPAQFPLKTNDSCFTTVKLVLYPPQQGLWK